MSTECAPDKKIHDKSDSTKRMDRNRQQKHTRLSVPVTGLRKKRISETPVATLSARAGTNHIEPFEVDIFFFVRNTPAE